MRKTAFLLSLFLTLHSEAQRIGIKTGLALTTYSATTMATTNPFSPSAEIPVSFKPGFVLGSFVDFNLHEKLSLRSGAELVVKGGTETGTYLSNGTTYTYQFSTNFAAIDFPLLLVYTTGANHDHGWLFGAGPVPGILIEGGLSKGDLGAGLLTGYQFRNGLNYNLSYHHGLINVAKVHYTYESLRNRHVALTVGYRFKASSGTGSLPTATAPAATGLQPAKSVYAELGGSGGFLSINYDTRLTKSNKGWGFRIGIGVITDLNSIAPTIPFGVNYLVGERSHFFEMGLGATFFNFSERNQDSWFYFRNEKFLAPYLWTGYRYQPPDQRFLFRAGFNQFFAAGFGGFMQYPLPGLSFGYSLR